MAITYISRHIKHREVNFPEITMVVCGTESLSARIQTQTFRFKVRLRTIPEKFMFPGREITCRKPKTRIPASSVHSATECRAARLCLCVYGCVCACVRVHVCAFRGCVAAVSSPQPAGSRRGHETFSGGDGGRALRQRSRGRAWPAWSSALSSARWPLCSRAATTYLTFSWDSFGRFKSRCSGGWQRRRLHDVDTARFFRGEHTALGAAWPLLS